MFEIDLSPSNASRNKYLQIQDQYQQNTDILSNKFPKESFVVSDDVLEGPTGWPILPLNFGRMLEVVVKAGQPCLVSPVLSSR